MLILRKKTRMTKEDVAEQWEKGYDLPINETERKEAEDECKKVLVLISDIYILADKGDAVNPVLDDKTIYKSWPDRRGQDRTHKGACQLPL